MCRTVGPGKKLNGKLVKFREIMLMFNTLYGVSSCLWEQMDTGWHVYVPAGPRKSNFLYTNFLPNFPPISIPFLKEKIPILTKLAAFYNLICPKYTHLFIFVTEFCEHVFTAHTRARSLQTFKIHALHFVYVWIP